MEDAFFKVNSGETRESSVSENINERQSLSVSNLCPIVSVAGWSVSRETAYSSIHFPSEVS